MSLISSRKKSMFWIKKPYFLVIGAPKYTISTLDIIFHAKISRTGKKVRHFKASFPITVISRSKSKKSDFSHFSHLNKKRTSDFVYFVFFYHMPSWQPSGVRGVWGEWFLSATKKSYILADFTVKTFAISKVSLLGNYL